MGFIIVLLLSTLSIAGSAAFFSIYGLAQIFAGSFWPVVVMASSLEAGKLVAASYVYRFWKDISFLMKTYLISAIIILMVITSAGIFGFLSAAYQTDTLSLRDIESQISLMQSEKDELRERKKEIDSDIGRISANYITKRMELIDKYSPETNHINTRIPAITAEIHKLKSIQIQEESHIGPIIYIAKVFNQDTDEATKWMILLIIFAFDPLAIALTIATNNAMILREKDKPKPIIKQRPVAYVDPEPEEAFSFSKDDIIEPIDDLELIIEPNPEPEPEDDEHIEEIYIDIEQQPGKVEVVKQENILDRLRRMFPTYNITDDTQITLQMFLKKRTEKGLTLHEREQLDRIIKTLRMLSEAQT